MKALANNLLDDFDEYLRQSEPHRRERAESWKTAIGLQAVDGLKPSEYLVETAKRHIEGDIPMEEVLHLIDSYYQGQDRLDYRTSTARAPRKAPTSSQSASQSPPDRSNSERGESVRLGNAGGASSPAPGELFENLAEPGPSGWSSPSALPGHPKTPRQKYLLTPRGWEMYQKIKTSKPI
ncbi:antitoxin VbhA family protein [Akkermansia muciniphila]|nr:antitoxin VbhA family protein [Akkermansia muciniphila]MCL6680045.1 antitoxin VbhA family protein [Akkermansia muciniphila]